MRYIQGENANIYDIYADMITFLQSVGWVKLKQSEPSYPYGISNRVFGPLNQTFMRLPSGDIVAILVCGRQTGGLYTYSQNFYSIVATPYFGHYDQSCDFPLATGYDSNEPTKKGSICFIESSPGGLVRSYKIFADERSLVTSFEIINGMPHIGAYLSKLVKTTSTYNDDMVVRGAVFYRNDERNQSLSGCWSADSMGKTYARSTISPFLYANCSAIKAGEVLKPAQDQNIQMPGMNAVRNEDGYAPMLRINAWYKHTDDTIRHVGYLKDMFAVSKNGLSAGEIITQAGAKYMIVDIYTTLFTLAVKIDD